MKNSGWMFFLMILFISLVSSCDVNKIEEVEREMSLKGVTMGDWVYMADQDWYYTTVKQDIDVCPEIAVYPFYSLVNPTANVSVFNDDEFVFFSVQGIADNRIRIFSVFAGAKQVVIDTPEYYDHYLYPLNENGPDYSSDVYKYFIDFQNQTEYLLFKIPIDNIEKDGNGCFDFNIKLYTVSASKEENWYLTSDGLEKSKNWWFKYCLDQCDDCPPQIVGDIVAAQHYDVGDLVIWEDDSFLYVDYQLEEGYSLDEAHLYIGCIEEMPVTKKGSPKNGNFPYHIEDMTDGVFKISLDDLQSICKDENGCWPIAAHAVVSKMIGDEKWEETAWSTGTDFEGNNWGWYSTYCPCE